MAPRCRPAVHPPSPSAPPHPPLHGAKVPPRRTPTLSLRSSSPSPPCPPLPPSSPSCGEGGGEAQGLRCGCGSARPPYGRVCVSEQVEIRPPNPNQVEIRSMPEFDRNLKFIFDQVRTGAPLFARLPHPNLSPTLASSLPHPSPILAPS